MLNKLRSIFHQKQTTLYASTVIVALTLLIARLLGLAKLRILTTFYSKEQLDLFFAAFRIPDFIFEVFVAGSIATSFIPMISDFFNQGAKRKKEVAVFAQTLSVIFLILWALIFVVMFFVSDDLTRLLVPGYSETAVTQIAQMSLTILFFQVPFLLLGNIISAILQTEKHFLIPGLAPAFYNLGIILGVIFWAEKYNLYGAIYGVVLGSILYFILLLVGLMAFKYPVSLQFNFKDQKIKQFFRLFVPRLFNSLTVQIDATIDLALSSLRGIGTYSSFYLARNLQIIPVSFLGIAISQTALPFFSRLYSQNKKQELVDLFTKLVLQIAFVTMPFLIFFTALRIPITRLFFGGDKFDWEGTVRTATVLSIFAISLPFHTIYYVITRAFFAMHDTKTPFFIGVIFTLLNSFLSIFFIAYLNLPVWYLALSFTIAISLNSLILFVILIKRLDRIRLLPVLIQLVLISFITVVTLLVVWLSKRLLDGLVFDTTRTINLFFLTLTCVFLGLVVYAYLAWVFVPKQLSVFFSLLYRFDFLKKTISRSRQFLYPNELEGPVEEKLR